MCNISTLKTEKKRLRKIKEDWNNGDLYSMNWEIPYC